MYIFEYLFSFFNFIFMIFLFICLIKKSFFSNNKRIMKIIWFFCSLISFIYTLLYIIYSLIVLNKDSPSYLDYKELMTMSLINKDYGDLNYLYPKIGILKTNEDGAFAKYNSELNKYEFLYPKEDENDIYGIYAKFKDLRRKQYNYDKDLYFKKYFDFNYEFMHCQFNDIGRIQNEHGKIYYKDSHGNIAFCQFLYSYNHGDSSYNKTLFGGLLQ